MSEETKEKQILGVVVSDKMDKTVIIEVKTRVTHPRIGKVIRRTRRLKIHDENREAKVGDTVAVVETRPISKEKRHKLHSVVEKAK